MACRALIANGVAVLAEVETGEDAFDAIAHWRPDVVLLNIRLPSSRPAKRRVLVLTRCVTGATVSVGLGEPTAREDEETAK